MRSKLFVPGSRPELFAKAFAGSADAISLDLEDSVSPNRKLQARQAVRAWLDELARAPDMKNGKKVIVRVNAPDTPYFEEDIRAAAHAAVDVVNLPKPDGAASVREISALIAGQETAQGLTNTIALLLNIETPRALRMAAELAAADERVVGLQLGLADLFEPLGIDRGSRSAVEQAMFTVSMAAGEAGIYAYDAAYSDIADKQGYTAEAELARRMGFMGKTCIHPSQVELANNVFQPSQADIEFARRVVAAEMQARKEGKGAYTVDGRMIDAPFVRRAEALLHAIGELPQALRHNG